MCEMCNVLFTFFACIPLIIHVNNDIILISRLDWNIKLRLIDHTNTPMYPSISSFFYKMGDTSNLRAFYFMFYCDYLCVSRNSNVFVYFTRTFIQTLYIFFEVKLSKYFYQALLMVFKAIFRKKIHSSNWK